MKLFYEMKKKSYKFWSNKKQKEKVKKKEYKTTQTSLPTTYKQSKTVYSNRGGKKNEGKPILDDIDVKYVSSLDEVLNDPNYWQDILSVA